MHHKAIKSQIRKQLKTKYPNWKRLSRKEKKIIAKMVLNETVRDYDFNQQIDTPLAELLGIQAQLPTAGMMDLEAMGRFIAVHENNMFFKFRNKKRPPLNIRDKELRLIDEILDDQIINKLLFYEGYSPAMRDLYPHNFLRAELLKAIKYPEISYRKFCGDDKTYEGKKIRIYDDVDCDCGRRRKKQDKSIYVVGYRLHTLSAINAQTGHSIPLISLLAPANHHDSQFLLPLVQLAKAIGLELKLVTADEAYHDNDGILYDQNGVHLIKPPSSKVSLPAHVDSDTLQVRLDELCEIPMQYIGIEEQGHEFKCGAEPGQCARTIICSQCRHIGFDNGYFQRLLYGSDAVLKALAIRKNSERPFNLLKKREGLEQVRVRSQHGLVAKSTFTTMATLLLEIAGTRRKSKANQVQMKLLKAA